MSEGTRTDERPSGSLTATVLDRFGARIDPDEPGWIGEESVGWRADAAKGPLFVQRFPRWRSIEELVWCDAAAREAATQASEVVTARAADDGRIAVETDDGPICVFPFVEGVHPGADGWVAEAAAELLARIHRGLAKSWRGDARPESLATRPVADHEPLPVLVDPELDRWERTMTLGSAPTAPIHGDFYAGNLIVRDGHIVGVIDWLEARIEHQVQEVSWAAWEFCQSEAGDDLVNDAALAFLQEYADAGGPADVRPPTDPIPWIRQRLRLEATAWFGQPTTKETRSEYHEGQVRAFHSLRGRTLTA
jgi:Ser/Thr protein kinase RdoA (MazF antagonist)